MLWLSLPRDAPEPGASHVSYVMLLSPEHHRPLPATTTAAPYTIVRRCRPLRLRFSSTLALSRTRWKNPDFVVFARLVSVRSRRHTCKIAGCHSGMHTRAHTQTHTDTHTHTNRRVRRHGSAASTASRRGRTCGWRGQELTSQRRHCRRVRTQVTAAGWPSGAATLRCGTQETSSWVSTRRTGAGGNTSRGIGEPPHATGSSSTHAGVATWRRTFFAGDRCRLKSAGSTASRRWARADWRKYSVGR